ncbi:hypothetical protein OG429_12515 [Streptomyces sp. NBC_00190]|uniref:hypothetical protein n=1 Tax=unclassified Streptomyces TaxID=2593676 RepID=UPI002E2A4109|nr:hypothetical protein [Streptomyces sp. NBC_00190]
MSTYATAIRRTMLCAAVVTAALTGAALTPAVASAASTTADHCTVTAVNDIGAGTSARMTMSPKGPSVTFEDGPGDPIKRLGTLDRAHPKLPASAGIYAEILNPYSATPKLKTKTQGGSTGYGTQDFPALPKGCTLEGAGKSSGTGTGQTSVVPKGPVAAGAEFGDGDGGGERNNLIGGGVIAAAGVGAAGFALLRRRAVGRG